MLVLGALAAFMWVLIFVATGLFFAAGIRDPFRKGQVIGWMFATGVIGAAIGSVSGAVIAAFIWFVPDLIFDLPQRVAVLTLVTGAVLGAVVGFTYGRLSGLTMLEPSALAKMPEWLAKRLDQT